METALQIIVGILVGMAAAGLHLAMAWRSARSITKTGHRRWALATMPIRITVAAALLVALALWGVAALFAGAVAFAAAERIGLTRITRQVEREGDGAP